MEQLTKQKGLTGFQLKYIAMLLMVLDHIHYFFEFTGKIPIWFSMLGRLSAPLFLFCIIEGFTHTHNRKKYFLQIYGIAIAMGLLQFLFMTTGIHRGDGFYPQNQMLATFTILLIILQGIDWCAHKKWVRGIAAILAPILYAYFVVFIGSMIPSTWTYISFLHYSILPIHAWISDGGTFFILQGILIYLFRKKRKMQAIVFFVSTILIYGVLPLATMPGLTIKFMLTDAFEWMGAFAAVIMLMYNGERGTGNKKFFYWFYPGHIYILYSLSCVLYFIMNK
ncbi:TraX family protein [Anaeromicropila herbilytica]|uniref:Membrane protein n=1 Tax=Anaeromicropila herbilytica TaxID=2785025 RepID=A0A7R7EP24_9FIRM|nr:TraX family protein [Anaeromicropila herbilytica]BCN32294.1 membrane protein [Anaeromicropila herbilytica]